MIFICWEHILQGHGEKTTVALANFVTLRHARLNRKLPQNLTHRIYRNYYKFIQKIINIHINDIKNTLNGRGRQVLQFLYQLLQVLGIIMGGLPWGLAPNQSIAGYFTPDATLAIVLLQAILSLWLPSSKVAELVCLSNILYIYSITLGNMHEQFMLSAKSKTLKRNVVINVL